MRALPSALPPLVAAALIATLGAGCASHGPQFSQSVATSFARDKMRKLQTASTEVYYPEQHRGSALRIAARIEHCVAKLRAQPRGGLPRRRVLVYLTSSDFNNAYVVPTIAGARPHMVVPQRFSLELFNWFGLGHHEVGDVGCHEAVHYVQNEQTTGLWRVINALTGGFISPNIFTESWFLEGLATYYEGHLDREVGRPHSPFWNAGFEAALAARGGRLLPGDLAAQNRAFIPYGANYLVGGHFVAYLARTHGEDKLWRLIEMQGDSIFSPFGVTLRFRGVYGKTIGQLFHEFADETARNFTPRERPAEQQVLQRDVGYTARLAAAPDGTTAIVSSHFEDVTRLTVRNPDGSQRYSRRLTQLLPPRDYVSIHPILLSGLTFTADGKWLFAALADDSDVGDTEHVLLKFDAATGAVAHVWRDLGGAGGGVSADGSRYVFIRLAEDASALSELDLATGAVRDLAHFGVGESLAAPSYSPDGARIAFSRRSDSGFDVFVRERDGRVVRLTEDGAFNYAPRWLDDRRLIFAREHQGRAQIALADTATHQLQLQSDVPYLALDPSPLGGDRIAFLNRDGFGFSLDTVPVAVGGDGPAQGGAAPPRKLPPFPDDMLMAKAPGQPAAAPPPVEGGAERTEPLLVSGAPVAVESDEPYSPLDHLFVPVLHAPFFLVVPLERRLLVLAGLSLQGADRLGFHNWALDLSIDTLARQPSFSLGYGNYQLAPWFLEASVARSVSGNQDATLRVVGLSAGASASRRWKDIPFSLFVQGQRQTVSTFNFAQTLRQRQFIGGGGAVEYFAGEGTPYGGLKRAIGGQLAGTLYLREVGSDDSMADLLARVQGAVPLPFSTRHSLRLSLRGRYLYGAEGDLLQVGGITPFIVLASINREDPFPRPDHLLSFSERLRGYEDRGYFAKGALIAGARYRYPLIVDRGITSVLYVLPSFFIRQVDLEVFGEGAQLDNGLQLGSVGGAVLVRTTLGGVLPIALSYQVAARLRLRPAHYVTLSFE